MKQTQEKTMELEKIVKNWVYKHNRKPGVEKYGITMQELDELVALLASSQDSFRRKVDELIRTRMIKFANTELKKRKNAFDEMAELNKDVAKLKNIK